MNKYLLTISIFASLLVHQTSLAGGFLKPSLYYSSGVDERDSKSEGSKSILDLELGYISAGGWLFGGAHQTENVKSTDTSSAGVVTSSESSRTSYGPSIGWTSANSSSPYVTLHYFLNSEYLVGTSKYLGQGYQGTLGYKYNTGQMYIALQLSYKSFEYKQLTADGTTGDLNPSLKQKRLDPAFSLWFFF